MAIVALQRAMHELDHQKNPVLEHNMMNYTLIHNCMVRKMHDQQPVCPVRCLIGIGGEELYVFQCCQGSDDVSIVTNEHVSNVLTILVIMWAVRGYWDAMNQHWVGLGHIVELL